MVPAPTRGRREPSYFGVYRAVVTTIEDPSHLGRVQLRLPALEMGEGEDLLLWATLCTPYADEDQGLLILPEVGSHVVVAFEAGDLRHPYVVGSTWGGPLPLPHGPESGNDIRMLRTRSDSRLEFDDAAAGPKISMTTVSGHQVVLGAGAAEVTITHSNGSTIKLTAAGSIEITAISAVNLSAPSVRVDAPISTFSGYLTLVVGPVSGQTRSRCSAGRSPSGCPPA